MSGGVRRPSTRSRALQLERSLVRGCACTASQSWRPAHIALKGVRRHRADVGIVASTFSKRVHGLRPANLLTLRDRQCTRSVYCTLYHTFLALCPHGLLLVLLYTADTAQSSLVLSVGLDCASVDARSRSSSKTSRRCVTHCVALRLRAVGPVGPICRAIALCVDGAAGA